MTFFGYEGSSSSSSSSCCCCCCLVLYSLHSCLMCQLVFFWCARYSSRKSSHRRLFNLKKKSEWSKSPLSTPFALTWTSPASYLDSWSPQLFPHDLYHRILQSKSLDTDNRHSDLVEIGHRRHDRSVWRALRFPVPYYAFSPVLPVYRKYPQVCQSLSRSYHIDGPIREFFSLVAHVWFDATNGRAIFRDLAFKKWVTAQWFDGITFSFVIEWPRAASLISLGVAWSVFIFLRLASRSKETPMSQIESVFMSELEYTLHRSWRSSMCCCRTLSHNRLASLK